MWTHTDCRGDCLISVPPVCASLQWRQSGLNFFPPMQWAVLWSEPQSILDFFSLLILLRISLICNLVLVDHLWQKRHISQLRLGRGITWIASFTYLSVISPRTENHCVLYFSRMFSRPMNVWSSLGNCLCLFFLIKTPIYSLKSSFTTLPRLCSKVFFQEQVPDLEVSCMTHCILADAGVRSHWVHLPSSYYFTLNPEETSLYNNFPA